MIVKTYNIQLVMTDETMEHWIQLLNVSREAFNTCVKRLDEVKPQLSMSGVHNTCYSYLRELYPSLPSQGVIRIQRLATAALKSIKSNKHKNADLPVKHSLSMILDKRLYSNLTVNGISITGKTERKREHCGFVLYDKVVEMFSKYNPLDPTIFYRNGKMYLSVPFEVPTLPCNDDKSIGVDMGLKRLFVTSDGTYFSDKEYLKQRRKLRYLKQCLQSKGTQSAKKHLRRVRRKETNLSKNMVECAVNVLLKSTNASILVLEDLSKIKQKTSKTTEGYNRKRHNNMLSQVPFYHFKERLSHKAQLVGKRVETVSPAFTSQTDSRSNKRDGNRVGCRYYCIDGIVFDADWNAAINIARRANHPISSSLPIDGGLMPLIGRVQSITQSSNNR